MLERFGFIPVVSSLHDERRMERLMGAYARAFRARRGVQRTPEAVQHPAPLLFFVVTGGTERQIVQLWQRRRESHPDDPVYLVAHPGHNALPAALEVLARLQQEGATGRIFYLHSPEDRQGLLAVENGLHDLEVRNALRTARIGVVGEPSEWLVASTPKARVVRERWGPELVSLPMEILNAAISAVPAAELAPTAETLAANAEEIVEPGAEALEAAVRVYLALRSVVTEHRLAALTLRCFDLLEAWETTGCFALAELNDRGIIAGCEGDMVTTVAMLWAYKLLGTLPWMANPSRLDEHENTLWLAHCTVPRSNVERYRLRTHFESGIGVGIQGEYTTGPVTLLRVGGRQMERLWLAEGEVLQSGDAEDLCRTQLEVQFSRGHISDLLREPLGNHLVVVEGHHAEDLRSWWETMVGLPDSAARTRMVTERRE